MSKFRRPVLLREAIATVGGDELLALVEAGVLPQPASLGESFFWSRTAWEQALETLRSVEQEEAEAPQQDELTTTLESAEPPDRGNGQCQINETTGGLLNG